jgi:chromosome segregation ATPase
MAFAKKIQFDSLDECSSTEPYAVTVTEQGEVNVVIPPGENETPPAKAIQSLCSYLAASRSQLRKKDKALAVMTEKITGLRREIADLNRDHNNLRELNKRLLDKLDEQRAAATRELKKQLELAQTKLEMEQNKAQEAVQIARQFAKEKAAAQAELRATKADYQASSEIIRKHNSQLINIRERLSELDRKIQLLERDNKKIREQLQQYQNHAKAVVFFNPHLLDKLPASLKAEL